MKKTLLILMVLLISLFSASVFADWSCVNGTVGDSQLYINISDTEWTGSAWVDIAYNVTPAANNCTMEAITGMYPQNNISVVVTPSFSCWEGRESTYDFPSIYVVPGSIVAANDSNLSQIFDATNYTIDYKLYNINISSDCDWNESNSIQFNFTVDFNSTLNYVDDWKLDWLDYNSSGFGENGTFWIAITNGLEEIDELNWTITWNSTCENCTWLDSVIAESCEGTQATIFAAFGLIALIGLVGAAFAIVGIFSGSGENTGTFIAVGVGLVALAIVVSIGYFIIAQVGASVCTLGPTS